MADMLSQAEIDALLNGTLSDLSGEDDNDTSSLDPQEVDALGEIGNISMGTSATTLFTLLGHKVTITTPRVSLSTLEEIAKEYSDSYVGVKVEYINGLAGSNLLIIKEDDVKIITDLMMGGDGTKTEGSLTDLHLSAISEAMNQMIGSASTSMSSMFDKKIEISPPHVFIFTEKNLRENINFEENKKVVKIAFKMVVGNMIDSEIMQVLPLSFAKKLVENLMSMDSGSGTFELPEDVGVQKPVQPAQAAASPPPPPPPPPQQQAYQQPYQQAYQGYQGYQAEYAYERPPAQRHYVEHVNVQPAQFQDFDESRIMVDKKNISLIMDVPLQVTVELGRTEKLIKDILEFSPGSIIELDKLAGEPVDILVNDKVIAKGEVVVIDESFGVRITDIIHPSKRL
ncbi:MAG: flagellar motor switch phosphatase FliY [Bacillota bacterium]